MTADYPDWGALQAMQTFITDLNLASQTLQATAAQIAAEIAETGVPLLAGPAILYHLTSSLNVPASASGQVIDNSSGGGTTDMSGYLSYDIHLQLTGSSPSSNPWLTFVLHWYDDLTHGIEVYNETWTCPVSNSGSSYIFGTGPVRGAALKLIVTNPDTVNAVTIAGCDLVFGSRPAPEQSSDWRNTTLNNPVSGYTLPTAGQNFDGIMAYFSGSLAESGTAALLAGMFNGPVLISVTVSGTSPSLRIQPQAFAAGYEVVDIAQYIVPGPSTDSQSYTINVPRAPLILALTNNNAADSVTYSITCVAAPAV